MSTEGWSTAEQNKKRGPFNPRFFIIFTFLFLRCKQQRSYAAIPCRQELTILGVFFHVDESFFNLDAADDFDFVAFLLDADFHVADAGVIGFAADVTAEEF